MMGMGEEINGYSSHWDERFAVQSGRTSAAETKIKTYTIQFRQNYLKRKMNSISHDQPQSPTLGQKYGELGD